MAELHGRYVTGIDGDTIWPAVNDETADTEWRLRYAPHTLSRMDLLFLASLVAAYRQMVLDPQGKRDAVCREIVATCKGEK